MLYVSSTLLLLVNAGTYSRVKILFFRVALLILLYYIVISSDSLNIRSLDVWIGIYEGLFQSSCVISFDLSLCLRGAILFFLIVYYPRRKKKSMGAMGKKIYSFFLTKYTIVLFGSLLVIYQFFSDIYSLCVLVPIKIYDNAWENKERIYLENRGLSGIYLWRN
jgi:hypothetical protein